MHLSLSIHYMFNSNGSFHTTFPECCALSGYCSSNFLQQDLLSISPWTLCVVLHITVDYVLSVHMTSGWVKMWLLSVTSVEGGGEVGEPGPCKDVMVSMGDGWRNRVLTIGHSFPTKKVVQLVWCREGVLNIDFGSAKVGGGEGAGLEAGAAWSGGGGRSGECGCWVLIGVW